MIALIQRVQRASVSVDGERIAAIDAGMLVFAAVCRGDTKAHADRLAERLVQYRLFADEDGRMNLNVAQAGGAILLVSQFTLAADTARGNRPSFTPAAAPDEGERLFEVLAAALARRHGRVECGRFAADMQVELINDGPVTFWLEVPGRRGSV